MSLLKNLSPFARILIILNAIMVVLVAVLAVLVIFKQKTSTVATVVKQPVKPITTNNSVTPLPSPTVNPSLPSVQQNILLNGFTKTIHPAGFEVTYPNKYTKLGDSDFTLSFEGPNSNEPGPHDFASLNFRILPLNGKSLEQLATENHVIYLENNTDLVDDIVPVTINGTKGYKYSCSFLVPQECIFFPLPNSYYLQLISTNADTENRGYKNEIDGIISTITIQSQ